MNNFEKHDEAQALADSKSAYALAREIIELRQKTAALAAHVERLRKAALDAIHFIPGGEVKAGLRDAYDEEPPK